MDSKGKFSSNFGFLMACLGSAVGLGNLWSFPYKLGMAGGFAFLLVYAILCITIGYPLVLSEIALGRKTRKATIQSYSHINKKYKFNGILQTAVPFLLINFYCTFGGYITKYLFASIAGLSRSASINTVDIGAFFSDTLLSNGGSALLWTAAFLALTVVIVLGGVSNGIEKFCKIAMPALFIMLIVIVIRACTLPGAAAGLSFLFKPNFSVLSENLIGTVKLAGSQMFFSLSLSSACLITYGSYLDKQENLERNAVFITLGDSLVAVLAGMAIMPAVFATGMEPDKGPGLLFVTMTSVFRSMGVAGRYFQLLFWLLVFFAALSSSIGMMEAGISAVMDSSIAKGKNPSRALITFTMAAVALAGNTLTSLDCLGAAETVQWFHILGQSSALDVWDALAEGILMPLTGLIMAIIVGWVVPHYLDDEIESGSCFKSKKLYNFCIRWIGPVFMTMILLGQISDFWGA